MQKSELSEEQLYRVETALRKANRLKALVCSFYELSIIDSGQIDVKLEKINISNLFMDFISEHAAQFDKKQIQPEISMPDSSIILKTDSNMLERIFQNLLANAIQYTAGSIKISLKQTQNQTVIFQIENPIADHIRLDADRLFERFYTGNQSRSEESTGLGLAVVKSLTEQLNGTIHASIDNNILSIQVTFI